MKVSYSQGLANQIDPKSCVRTSNRPGEALTGERAGRVLSREIHDPRRSADVLGDHGRPHCSKSLAGRPARRETWTGSARSETPDMHGCTLRGNRESLCLPAEKRAGCIGKSKDTRR